MIPERHSFKAEFHKIVKALLTPSLVSAAWEPGSSYPEPQRIEFQSLWDTGATGSAISKNVFERLGLHVEGYAEASHAYGKVDKVPVHYVNFVLLNSVQFVGIPVLQGDFTGFDVLIGMDVISMGDFVITNREGTTEFSFRVPSIENFDFVKEDNIFNRRKADSEIRSSSNRPNRRQKKKKKG